jgi:choline dehydrogenase-like flavoprotein
MAMAGPSTQVHYFVGGATKVYVAALYRLRERDFAEIKHPDGISPAWPIGGRHELLPEHRCGQPCADGDGERSESRRPPCGTAQVTTLERHAQVGHHVDDRSPRRDAELAIYRLHLRLHSVGRDIESLSDLRERQMGGKQRHQPKFGRRQ